MRAVGVNPIDYKSYSGALRRRPVAAAPPHRLGGLRRRRGDRAGRRPASPSATRSSPSVHPARMPSNCSSTPTEITPKPPEVGVGAEPPGCMLTGTTAVHAAERRRCRPGRDGAGARRGRRASGLMLVQLAVARKAHVIATASAAQSRPAARHSARRRSPTDPGSPTGCGRSPPSGIDAATDLIGTDEAIDTSLELVAAAQSYRLDRRVRTRRRRHPPHRRRPRSRLGDDIRRAARSMLTEAVADGLLAGHHRAHLPVARGCRRAPRTS